MQPELQKQYVQFSVCEEMYAIPISGIHEIIRMKYITFIPASPTYMIGVIHLRDALLPVISLSRLFHKKEPEATKESRIMVVHYRGKPMGMVVDRVEKVVVFSDIQEASSPYGRVGMACICRIGIAAGELVGIINLDELQLDM